MTTPWPATVAAILATWQAETPLRASATAAPACIAWECRMHVSFPNLSPLVRLFPIGRARQTSHAIATPGYFLHWLGIQDTHWQEACQAGNRTTFSYIQPLQQAFADADQVLANGGAVNGFPAELHEALQYAVCVVTDSLPAELGPDQETARRIWRARLSAGVHCLLDLFQTDRPAVVVLLQGFEPHNAVARCAAGRLGIPFLSLENTALATRMVWDNVSGITTNRNLARNYYWRYRDSAGRDTSEAYCRELIRHTRSMKSPEHTSPATSARMTDDRPQVLFLGQVYTDASQVFGLRHWSSPVEVLHCCARWCAQHDHALVVKLHPKEQSGQNTVDGRPYDQLTYRRIQQDASLLAQLDSIGAVIDSDNALDTYDLIDQCAVAVTVNSQAGLEAAIRGKPVVVCGDAFYAGLDFTWDAPHPALFASALDGARGSASRQTAVAREFAYIFFEKYCRSKAAATLLQLIEETIQ